MTTTMALGIVLFVLMMLVGGRAGVRAFIGLLLNFGVLFFAIVLVAFHFPPLTVTLVTAVIVLALTIFLSADDDLSSTVAFLASLAVLAILVLLIIPVEQWAQVQGFGPEDSEDLEGMSLLIGIPFIKVAMATAILSTLGAIAEAAMAISSGLNEILEQHPKVSEQGLMREGMAIGRQIMGTTFNTLFFGFFGGFLALFVWFSSVHYTFGEILNDKIFVAQVLMVLFAMVSVILVVPATTWIMARFVRYRRRHDLPVSGDLTQADHERLQQEALANRKK
ncbi:YibE/F family protein [Levilactobacillus bambusae]|uniref:YibE/F family protein n=1 Tax=Levilactobacillus bambusae TaxID=2024736 RepID=A0A2V1MYL5_9LACO|nr:YibE/F family protein [Levilactobacillus bambusae]PWG00101.1 hypothetical protein DCM90_03980 [Levilactobacillus bambusae]